MQRAFADNPDWRHIPPVVSGKADAPVAGAYVAERIQELKALLDRVVHDDWSRAWAWQKAISQYGNNAPADPPDNQPDVAAWRSPVRAWRCASDVCIRHR